LLHIQERFTLILRALEAYLAYEIYAQTPRQPNGGACVLRLTLAGTHTWAGSGPREIHITRPIPDIGIGRSTAGSSGNKISSN